MKTRRLHVWLMWAKGQEESCGVNQGKDNSEYNGQKGEWRKYKASQISQKYLLERMLLYVG